MRNVRVVLMLLLGLMACAGMGVIFVSGLGDAGVMAGTSGVYQALEVAGQQDNDSLRNDLYNVVLRLKQPWSIINVCGIVVVIASMCSFSMVWRKVR